MGGTDFKCGAGHHCPPLATALFWKPVCTTGKSNEDEGVQLFNNKVFRSRSLRERPTKFPMSLILHMLRGFADTSSLPVAPDACGCSSTGGQVPGRFTVVTAVNKNF